MKLSQLDHVALTVTNPLKFAEWYQSVSGLERRYQEVLDDYPVVVGVGSTCIALFPSLVTLPAEPPERNETITMRHLAFKSDWANFLKV